MAIPTPTASLSTTCLVVTQPASYDTITYTSGETPFFGDTTYTAPTAVVNTFEATIEARCFTLLPGQTPPAAVPYWGASCSTEYSPASTETTTITYTPGEVFTIGHATIGSYRGTTTSYATETYTYPASTDVYCKPVPDVQNQATCDRISPLTWASLVITFITVHLTWWLFDVPLLWKKRAPNEIPSSTLYGTQRAAAAADANDRIGLAGFLWSIAWACLRANAPGCAALYVLFAGRDTGEYAALYYLGVRRLRNGRVPDFTTWKLLTSIGSDVLTLIVVAVTVYQACTLPESAPRRFGAGMWAYPTLPNALIGLCLMVGQRYFPRTRRAAVGLVAMVVGVVVVVGAVLGVLLWRFDRPNSEWFIPIIFYGIMAFPAILMSGMFVLLAIAYGCFGRIGGVTIAAWGHYAGGQVYCKMAGPGFAIVYLILGIISALLALLALALNRQDIRWRTWYKSAGSQSRALGISDDGHRTEGPKEWRTQAEY
ncbi:uncharacterized protein C8A04DRAFT_9038 [Dichotomopilus funicola]|uniref:Uncharacterized protein n=1 Tax=Dichotomopilus funicola TaxID=1934379 RepID=A0AAN6VB48_9PEZI|nr:hypothetical protein C8A04DRAFT_9038 [Dichotomopilus funicola]